MNDSVGDILDATLDDLEDLPEFVPFNKGAHRATVSFELKTVNNVQSVELSAKLIETVELADPQDEPQKEGTVASCLFMLDNEFGRGNLKKVATPFGEAMGISAIRDVIDQVKDVEVVMVTGIRPDKKDDTKLYMTIQEISPI